MRYRDTSAPPRASAPSSRPCRDDGRHGPGPGPLRRNTSRPRGALAAFSSDQSDSWVVASQRMPLVNHLRRGLQNVLALPPVTALAVMRAKAFANKAACGRGATALLDHGPAVRMAAGS